MMATVQNIALNDFAKSGETGKLAATFQTLVARFQAWNEMRKTANELNRLSNAQLRDIGIYRSDIPAVARGVFDGRRG